MAGVLDKLRGGDLRSIGMVNEVVSDILEDRALFAPVFNGIFNQDPVIRMRAADAIEKVTRSNPEWLLPYKERLIEEVSKIDQQEVQWHLAQMLSRVEFENDELEEIINMLRQWIKESKSKIVKVNSMQTLADLAERYLNVKPLVIYVLQKSIVNGSPAVVNRGSKLIRKLGVQDKNRSILRADCERCFGLCCVALYFSASEGFPIDKEAGEPCPNLQPDFHCCIHKSLIERGMKGCIAFDCFGAGQKVAKVNFGGQDWRRVPESSKQMFEVFLIMRQLHELLWYLTEALTLQQARLIQDKLSSKLDEIERLTRLSPGLLTELDVAAQRAEVNTLLVKASELVRGEARCEQKTHPGRKKTFGLGANLIAADLRRIDLRGANLRGACLIAADLRGTDLIGTDFIGADFRDADLRGADLSKSIFLTQAQLNAAKGDISTKLPSSLTRPKHWSIST